MQRGRPRIFVTPAEKQKAYRERLKAEKALRNSSGNENDRPLITVSEPRCDSVSELEMLWARVQAISDERQRLLGFSVPTVVNDELSYGGMSWEVWYAKLNELYHEWDKAHGVWAELWRKLGSPCGSWTKH